MDRLFSVSPAPHVRAKDSTALLMLDVITALMPCAVAGVWLFGWEAARVLLISVACCVASEYGYQKIAKKPLRINNLSAVVTGLILGLSLPSTAPWWMILIGALVAIVLVKELFGGIGDNFVNPAMAARAVLLASWPAYMAAAAYVTPFDAVSVATPLADTGAPAYSMLDMFIGRMPGSIGEVCKLGILIGLAYLLIRKTISWHIPVAMLGSFALFTLLLGGDPVNGLLTGSVLFGAVFMATDYTTSPMTGAGKLIYAAGAGLIIALIRAFGSYPEGTTYGILLMNIATPLIDRATKLRVYGQEKAEKKPRPEQTTPTQGAAKEGNA